MLLVRLAYFAAWALAFPWLLVRRLGVRVRPGTYVLVEVDGRVDDIAPPRRLWPPGAPRHFSVHSLEEVVDAIADDERVRGLVVVVKSMRCGFATSASLRAAVERARAKGKEVVVHLPRGGGTKETYVAMAADRVVLGPQAHLAPVGILSSTRYVRGALDRAGVVPEVLARGPYKTAAEPLERTTMSDPQREQIDAVLDRLHGELVRAISNGRRVDAARARALVDDAPYGGEEAVQAGLADAVAYEDEIGGHAAASGSVPLRRAGPYVRARRALRSPAWRTAGVIAVVRVHGPIVAPSGLPLGRMAVDERIISAVRAARSNRLVRGVVLHVDSPGGGALASDRIHHELAELAARKPLVACLSSVAASGGYYVAAAASQIIAQPTTITGSIGVVAARFVVDPLLARLGIATYVLQRGAHARLLDPSLPLDENEKRVLGREIDRIYRAFLLAVARGRGRPVEAIEPLAGGRVWTGQDALSNGLVDGLGGLDDALEALRSRIGQGADRLRVVVMKPPRVPPSPLDAPDRKAARVLLGALEPAAEALGIEPALLALGGERVLAWSGAAASIRV